MKKIKDRVFLMKEMSKNLLSKFPVTMIVIAIATIICAITIDTNLIDYDVLTNIFIFAAIFASSTFLIETVITEDKKKQKIIYYIIAYILASLFTIGINIKSDILGIENAIFLNRIRRLVVCYILTVIISAIYFMAKNSKKSFNEYLVHVTSDIFKTSIIYGILAIGVALVTSIFIFLILNGKKYTLVLRLEVLLLGIYLLPNIIYSFYNMESEISKFIKILIKYILDVLVIIAFTIIYLYIAKIIILRNMPSNQIYRIIAILFVIGCPIWTMAQYFKEDTDTLLDKINRKLPILFIPFIFLQIYTIGVRIVEHGITEARYLCVALILFEIIYVILYIKNKEKVGNILLSLAVIIIVSGIVPYINMYAVSVFSQSRNLDIYHKKQNYTQEEKDKIKGAYYYLRNSIDGEKIIKKSLTQNDIEIITSFTTEVTKVRDIEYIYASNDLDFINVADYNRFYIINSYKEVENIKSNVEDNIFSNVKFSTESNLQFELDLTSLMQNYIVHRKDINSYIKKNYEMILNENQKIVIESISFSIDEVSNKVKSYNISGYLLER